MTLPYYSQASTLFPYTRDLRRDFHRHPELGFLEVRTAGIVTGELRKLGLEVSTGIAETGVVAMIEGARPGPVVLLRFDMDALPIQEATGAEYASQVSGVMHACGHDGHTAIGLTVAQMLHARRHEFGGSVKLVFQPAEEGLGGAERMIKEGILNNPPPDRALGLHIWNDNPVGWVGVAPGPVMAAGDKFTVRITGKGGHGAAPHLAIDPVLASAQVISALQSIVSRSVPPLETAVVSVTTIHGGEAFNVIPSMVELSGTIRTFEPAVRQVVLERFHQVIEGVAASLGCRAEIEIIVLTPPVMNDPQTAARLAEVFPSVIPNLQLDSHSHTMGSEDMAYILREVPGCFFFVGSANPEKRLDAAHHHPRFDIDETALIYGAALMTAAALELLD